MGFLKTLIARLARLNDALAVVFRLLALSFLAAMMLFIVLQVVLRYGFNNSLDWPEDVSLMMMIWVAFAVAPIAYKTSANVALDSFARLLKGRAGFGLHLLIHALVLVLMLALVNEAVALIGRTQIRANSIPVSMRYIYAIMPVGLGATALVALELIARCALGLVRPLDPDARAPADGASTAIQQG